MLWVRRASQAHRCRARPSLPLARWRSPSPSPSPRAFASALTPPRGARSFAGATQKTVSDLLAVSKEFRRKQTNHIFEDQTISDAVALLATNENSATLVVVSHDHKVRGLLTNHILLDRISKIRRRGKGGTAVDSSDADLTNTNGDPDAEQMATWNTKIMDIAIPAREVLHVSPDDSLENCRAVMALSGRGELPVLEGGKLLGTVSLIDIASLLHRQDELANASPSSAKSDYINVILPRKGLPLNTSLGGHLNNDIKQSTEQFTYYLHSFAMSIPHPGKKDTGGEDAFFVGTTQEQDEQIEAQQHAPRKEKPSAASSPSTSMSVSSPSSLHDVHVGPVDVLSLGVSDGVGSWFEKGVSAKLYAQELMRAAHQAAQISFAREQRIDPGDVLHAAWSTVLQREIVGSATACVLSLDPRAVELHAVNLGDSGFLIIRDKTSDLESARQRGTLDGSLSRRIRDRESDLTPAGRRKGAHVSYRSPQQLHYFNCPFQLGFGGSDIQKDVAEDLARASSSPSPTPMNEKPLFETPRDGVRLRVPVLEGDLILLATDGLFDNMDEEVLLEIVSAQPDVEMMTRQLVARAYELSLDRSRDSPFARLAKENDLMWGGGMPDDITIIAARVQKKRVGDGEDAIALDIPALGSSIAEQARVRA